MDSADVLTQPSSAIEPYKANVKGDEQAYARPRHKVHPAMKFDFDELPKEAPLEYMQNRMEHVIADAVNLRAMHGAGRERAIPDAARQRASRRRTSGRSVPEATRDRTSAAEGLNEDEYADIPQHDDDFQPRPPPRSKSYRDTANNHYSKAQLGDVYDNRTIVYMDKKQRITPLEIMAIVMSAVLALGFVMIASIAAYSYLNTSRLAAIQPSVPGLDLGAVHPKVEELGGQAPDTQRIDWQKPREARNSFDV